MAQIRIDIASEFKDKGIKNAEKGVLNLDKNLKKLGKTIIGVFAARKIIQFGKASVRAFAEEDREIKQLTNSLNNLGLGYQGLNIEDFISQLQSATAVSDGELRPALSKLANATLDLGKAQKLLGLSLDISAATGKSLDAVTTGLTRAYLKDVSALSRLGVGLTAAELKTMSFDEAVATLQERFSGSAGAAADSYQGKLNSLTIAVDEAKEAIGKDLVKALETLAEGDWDKVLGAIASSANAIGSAINYVAYQTAVVKALIGGAFKGIGTNETNKQIALLKRQFGLIEDVSVRGRNTGGATQFQKQQLALEKKIAAERKKADDAAKKAEAMKLAQKRANTVFDLENIQIVAAMQGKIDGEQRMRLTAMLALNTENYIAAEKLTDIIVRLNAPALANLGVLVKAGDTVDDVIKKLITSQAKLAGLQLMAEDFPELDNPFEDWETTLENILALLMQILNMSNKKAGQTGIYALDSLGFSSLESYQNYRQGERASIVNSSFSTLGSSFVGSGMTNSGGVTVNVNVAGNITTQNDLVSSITNALYQRQKDGQSILYSSTAI